MNKNYYFIMLTLTTIASLAFTKISNKVEISKFSYKNSHIRSTGAPAGKSGAPGESNCTDCHSGTVQDGAGINELALINLSQEIVTEYTPGETYTVAITTEAAAKRGFQVSPRILSDNTKAGTSVGITGSSALITENNLEYITHTSFSNTSSSGWLFTWTAPATDVGDIRFYYAANISNNNNTSSGDLIRTSQHTFSAESTSSIYKKQKDLNFSVGYLKESSSLVLNYSTLNAGSAFVNIIDMSGKSVFTKRLDDVKIGSNEALILLPKNLQDGVYVVNFFVNNNSTSKKIMITN
jgi:hypothetical protein